MLYEFLTTHRADLIRHCRERVAKRYAPAQVPPVVDHGVPLFLEQLGHTLISEHATTARKESEPEPSPVATDIGRAATKLSLIHISEPTRLLSISYAVFC